MCHLQVVTEHLIKGNFQGADSGVFNFPLLDLKQHILPVKGNVSQLVQFLVHAFFYHVPLRDGKRRLVFQLFFNFLKQQLTRIEHITQSFE